MDTVTLKDAEEQFPELARRVEAGETVTVTRDGKPVFDLVPHRQKSGGINFEAVEALKRKYNVENLIEYVAEDFDSPLPEDFLITPLPK